MRRALFHAALACGVLFVSNFLGVRDALATTIVVNNVDGANEGFNDPTAVAPVGGNAGTTLGAQRLNVFNYAANIWESVLTSSVPIQVDAKFDPQQCDGNGALLGSAAPWGVFHDFAGAAASDTWYPSAIADKQSGVDQEPGEPDIVITYNSNVGSGGGCPFTFYLGLDGNAGSDIDLASVVLHELAHGLGFTTLLLPNGGQPYDAGLDDHFAHWLEDHTLGLTMPAMTQAQRHDAQLNTGNLHFVGPLVRAASSILSAGAVGDHVRMYAPNPYQGGSSVAHFDTFLSPDQAEEPFYTGPNHDPGLALPLLCDVGWAPCKCGNGTVDAGEGCDDGATDAGDGCNAICQVEECWSCAGEPSVCTLASSGTPCNDHDGCTQTDECDSGGACIGSNPVTCTPLDDCHVAGTCQPANGQCTNPPAPDGTACDDGDTCTATDVCSAGECVGLPSCIDPFLCYKAKTDKAGGGFSPPAPQTLVDEFNEVADFNVAKPKYLCTPAQLNGAPQVDAATHLEGYSIKYVSGTPHTKRTHITITNELSGSPPSMVVDTVKPDFLLVPTAKSLVSDPSPPGGGIEVDHYECYKIKVSKGTTKFPKGVSASIADQFIASAQSFGVVKLSHLCNPVDKEGEGIKHTAVHQLCYSLKRTVKNPQHLGLFTHNQFGAERLDTISEAKLCVPSIEGPPPPPPLPPPSPPGVLVHDYELNGLYTDTFGGPDMTPNGGTLGGTGYTLAAGQGPSLSGAVPASNYAIEMGFSIDTTTSYRKLIDVKNRTADAGVYNLNTSVVFYPGPAGPSATLTAGVQSTLVLSRDGSTGIVTVYVDGVLQLTVNDSGSQQGVITSDIVHFLRDDMLTSTEQSSGFLDYVKIYDGPIVP